MHLHPFEYHRAASLDDALARLGRADAVPLGGGTDLLVQIKEELSHPGLLVDLRSIPGWSDLSLVGGGARIGAGVRVERLARDPQIRTRFPMLSEACAAVGTPALRHMGTLGGNLCQRPRCWYFRRGIPCLKNGGQDCPARDGENQYHAILGGGPCWIVHPSDPAVALTALDAVIELRSADGARTVPISEFYLSPRERLDHETVLRPGEIVAAVSIPAGGAGTWQRYDKIMQRGAWDFALVSLAAARRENGDVRLVLGGVAPVPWRVTSSIEEDVAAGGLDDTDIAILADRALYDAEPLSRNGYKVELAAALLRRAIAAMIAR